MPKSDSGSLFAKAIKDPLIHFLILGALLFALSPLWSGDDTPAENDIIITQAGQKHLADLFNVTWQRTPTADELANLVEEHIKEEVYYREALALGLDSNDTIVRRRMRQKLEFMQEDLSNTQAPSDTALKAYYAAHSDKFQSPRRVSFKQVLISKDRLDGGNDGRAEVSKNITALNTGTRPAALSRSSLLPISINLETASTVTNTFGQDFIAQFATLKSGQWDGPIYSAFGTHLVHISLDQAATPLPFNEARAKVQTAYTQENREKFAEDYYQNLRKQYRIKIENLSK